MTEDALAPRCNKHDRGSSHAGRAVTNMTEGSSRADAAYKAGAGEGATSSDATRCRSPPRPRRRCPWMRSRSCHTAVPHRARTDRDRAWRSSPWRSRRLAGVPAGRETFLEAIEPGHRLGVEREVEHRGVLGDALAVDRFRHHDVAVLDPP